MTNTRLMSPGSILLVCGFVAVKGMLFFLFGDQYNYHGDELYFLACADHPAFGYVDHGPVIVWLAWMTKLIPLPGLYALRFLSFAASSAALVIVVKWAAEAGARAAGQAAAGLAMLFAPVYLRASNLHHIPSFELLIWTSAAYTLWLLLNGGKPRLWIGLGALLGLGMLTKILIGVWAAGLGLGLLYARRFDIFRSRHFWSGAAVFLLIAAPHAFWQAVNGWPTMEFSRSMQEALSEVKDLPFLFLAAQLLYLHPAAAVIWITGLLFSFRRPDFRPFAIAYVLFAGVLLLSSGKPYYLAAAYPPLIAVGVVQLSRYFDKHGRLGAAFIVIQAASGAALVPLALPALPLERTNDLIGRIIPFVNPADLTSEFREQFGWQEKAQVVSKISRSRPSQPVVLARHYMEAAAVARYAPGVPVISPHMNWYLWGSGKPEREYLVVGYSADFVQKYFRRSEMIEVFQHPSALPWSHGPLFIAGDPVRPVAELWPEWKRYHHN